MNARHFRILLAAAVACSIGSASCSEEREGTMVTLVNGTSSMIRGIIIVAGTDTLRTDTLQSGADVTWTVVLEPAATMELSWVEGAETLNISPSLLDSAGSAESLELTILTGELNLKVSYRF